MQQTRLSIVNDVLEHVGELGDDDARTYANRLLSRVLERLWLKHPWSAFRAPVPTTVSTVALQRAYPLPPFFGRVASGRVRNLSNGTELVPATPDELDDINPYAGTSYDTPGTPERYSFGGTVGVSVQPTTSTSALTVVSSSSGDNDVDVTVTGRTVDKGYQRASVTLAGTAPVSVPGTWLDILTVSKSFQEGVEPPHEGDSSRGTVTLKDGSTSLVALPLDESSREHIVLVLDPTPVVTGYVITLPTIRSMPTVAADSDVLPDHWGPMVFEEMVVQFKLFNGEINSDADVPRPAFLEALAYDQTGRLGTYQRRIRSFQG